MAGKICETIEKREKNILGEKLLLWGDEIFDISLRLKYFNQVDHIISYLENYLIFKLLKSLNL